MIADIGTGPYIAQPLRIAEKVGPKGRIVCVDITSAVIAKIKDQIALHHVTNIEVVLGKEDDPLLPPGTFDAILVSNTYHEFTQPAMMLQHLAAALKPSGKLVVVELYSGTHKNEARADQIRRHDLSPDLLEQELKAAGLVIKERIAPVPLDGDRFRYGFGTERAK